MVLDPIFKRVGLSGKTVIPMVIGTGCGIPAIMACRTIRNERERRTSAMLATGFTVGFLVYQIGTLITTGSIGAGFAGGLIAVLVFAAVITGLIVKANRGLDSNYALNRA